MPKRRRRRGVGEPLNGWWRLTYAVLYYPASALARTSYENVDDLPLSGPAILAVNHVSHVDPFLLSKFVLDAGRVPRFLAKDSIFRVRVVGRVMRGMGHVPVVRGSAEAQQSLDAAVAALGRGEIVMMYPEGTVTRDPDGWPMAGRTGTARLGLLAPSVPIIPVAQWGIQNSIDLYRKKVRLWPRPRHAIRVGKAIDLSRFDGQPPTSAVLADMTDVIMRTIRGEVAQLRGLPSPSGALFRWRRPQASA
ncbi:MAG: 1-acyl-sn-glycerol-3-phosphate acyltransferase [Actinobacteria bacterium]|nr:1-acyl-sn-glycerol-3-phosphate acyltransferase [Actinomycetota bacterium]